MGTTIRPEVSKSNIFWINKHRYYELKHFCLQYPSWKKAYAILGFINARPLKEVPIHANSVNDPTAKRAQARLYYSYRIKMLEKTAENTDSTIGIYILKAVTTGMSYDTLKAKLNIPCCKEVYYKLYHKFFWLLNQARQ